MDRPANPDVRVLLAASKLKEVLYLREMCFAAGLPRLADACTQEIRRRSELDIEQRLRPYQATLRRTP